MPDPHESSPAARLGRLLKEKGLYCATAESCTGGLIGAALTDIPGSSEWYRGGVISYANEAKIRLLGVSGAILATRGAVSEEVAVAMAQGACGTLGADVAMASTGIARAGRRQSAQAGGDRMAGLGRTWQCARKTVSLFRRSCGYPIAGGGGRHFRPPQPACR